jgi:hypothetical protein
VSSRKGEMSVVVGATWLCSARVGTADVLNQLSAWRLGSRMDLRKMLLNADGGAAKGVLKSGELSRAWL